MNEESMSQGKFIAFVTDDKSFLLPLDVEE